MALEDVRPVFLVDTGPIVGHRDHDGRQRCSRAGDLDAAGGEAERVVDEVGDDLGQAIGVGDYRR